VSILSIQGLYDAANTLILLGSLHLSRKLHSSPFPKVFGLLPHVPCRGRVIELTDYNYLCDADHHAHVTCSYDTNGWSMAGPILNIILMSLTPSAPDVVVIHVDALKAALANLWIMVVTTGTFESLDAVKKKEIFLPLPLDRAEKSSALTCRPLSVHE
jgi:hypothetical protein